jgi:toxin-antitoxin system PIN domain toxin
VIAVDTNILVYAHRPESDWHKQAEEAMRSLCEGADLWTIPWPCVHEFLSVVTNPRIYTPPTPTEKAFVQLRIWLDAPTARLIGESKDHLTGLERIVRDGKLSGGAVHDARIAAICASHGVRELWSADRGFSRMTAVRVRNPLIT